jgi:hypothetical protein
MAGVSNATRSQSIIAVSQKTVTVQSIRMPLNKDLNPCLG